MQKITVTSTCTCLLFFAIISLQVSGDSHKEISKQPDDFVQTNSETEGTFMIASIDKNHKQTSRWLLWYTRPAEKWIEALPIGNGRMGAMVFGGITQERIQLNEETVWDGYERDTTSPDALAALPEVRRLLFEGKNKEAEELAKNTLVGRPGKIHSYQSLGDLNISFPEAQEVKDYRRSLDIERGIAATHFTADGTRIHREVFASVPDQVIVVHLSADNPGKISLRANLSRVQDAESLCLEDNRLVLRGQIQRLREDTGENAGLKFECHALPVCLGGKIGCQDNSVVIENADEVYFIIAAATNYRGKEPEVLCRTWIEHAAKSYEELRANHVADHQKLFNRVDLYLGNGATDLPTDERLARVAQGAEDPDLVTLYFQYGRYLLMGCSRPGCLPANLQGVWNEHMQAPWQSDYHTNINVQMNYWPAEVTNLSECHLPLIDFMESLVPSGERTAKVHYGARGWVVHHITDIFGFTTPHDSVLGIWPMGAAWLCWHPYEHYLYTGDVEFLRNRAYPLMKGAALFLLDFLVEDSQGRLVTCPSHSPENTFIKPDGTHSMFTYGATMDLMIIHNLFSNCIEASRILNTDEDFRQQLESALKRLAPLQISPKTGRLQEWIEDYDEAEPGHRHMSHLFGLHPGCQITLRDTPELAAAARKSLEYRLAHGGGHTGWSRAWIVNFWARFEEPEKAYENLQALLAKSTLPNLFDDHPPFQIDGNFGGTAGIAEMLLQSHTGSIHLLPALPKAWNTGYFRGLRARGGYTIGLAWKDGNVTSGVIKATQNGICRIRCKTPIRITCAGKYLSPRQIESDLLEFDATKNSVYEIIGM